MIKKYNQFVNEELEFGAGDPAPTRRETETPTRPDTDRPTAPRPTRPGSIPDDVPSEQDNPLAKNVPFEGEFDGEVEEEDPYIAKLKELAVALKLGEDVVQNNRIILKKNPEDKGKEITFPSETGKFHVDRKKFDTVEQVVSYLDGGATPNAPKLEDEDRIDPEFEAKSYRFSRREKRLK